MNSKILPVFPCLSAALKERDGSDFTKSASEYLEVIKYHFDFMFESKVHAEQIVNSIAMPGLDGLKVRITPDEKIVIDENSINEIARFGDITIREASTTLEIALLLTNFVAGELIPPKNLAWYKKTNRKFSLKTQLNDINLNESRELADAISVVWESIGHYLLSEYRNWVTHRGAPLVRSKINWEEALPFPTGLTENQEKFRNLLIIQQYLRQIITENVSIACAPFYPDIKGYLNETFTEENNPFPNTFDIQNGGSISFIGTKIRTANLLENKEDYLAEHKVGVAQNNIIYAGENISTYKVEDYLSATHHITSFIWECFSGEWDAKLAKLFLLNEGKIQV